MLHFHNSLSWYGWISLLFSFLVLTVDYEARSVAVTFEACMTRVCEALSLVDDDIAEGVESFYLTLERPTDLDSRIILNPKNGEVMIHDDEST